MNKLIYYHDPINKLTKVEILNSLIYKSKSLIFSKIKLSIIENRWISILYSKINSYQYKLKKYYNISFNEYSEIYNILFVTTKKHAELMILNKKNLKYIYLPNDSLIDYQKKKFINNIKKINNELLFYINEKDMSPHLLKKT